MRWLLKASREASTPGVYLSTCLPVYLSVLSLLAAALLSLAISPAAAQSSRWSEPILLSTNSRFSWFPDLAVDYKGRVHVVWDSSPNREKLEKDSLLLDAVLALHTVLDRGTWSTPNDIWYVPGRAKIYRLSIAADATGHLYLVSGRFGFSTAPADTGASAQAWSEPRSFLAGGGSYGSALTVDAEGVIHLIWDTLVEVEGPDPEEPTRTIEKLKADVFYRRSADGGQTWSPRVDLSNTNVGENRPQIKVDRRGVVYASWDTGWDRQTEESAPIRATVFTSSFDGGETWSPLTVFDTPDQANAQMAIQPDGDGGVLAVWRSLTQDNIYYAWSTDDGRTWSSLQSIPFIFARDINETRFDGYHMATDSAGVIHLVVVGRLSTAAGAGVYHLTWDGQAWSSPEPIYTGAGWPEWPRIAISQGNQMHVVWFVRDQLFTGDGNTNIWYSTGQAEAPRQPLPPTRIPTPTQLPPTPTLQPTATPKPVLPEAALRANPTQLRDEKDDLIQIVIATLPIALLLGVFVIIAKSVRTRL